MIPTYRPGEHLREALLSAKASLEACGSPYQLTVVDDASPDVDVKSLLGSWGMSDVDVFRRHVNGGLGNCWNTCIERARGDLIHVLHQDDLVKPRFHARMRDAALTHPQAGMIFCRTELLSSEGRRLESLEQAVEGPIEGWLERITAGQRLQCPSVVMRRETYLTVGLFDVSLRYVIDWEMWVRVAASMSVCYVPEPLAVYRIHDAAATKGIKAAGIVTKDFALAFRRVRAVLSSAGRSDCIPNARAYAISASGGAIYEAECAGNARAVASEIWASAWGLGLWTDPAELLQRVRRYARILMHSPRSV